MDYYAQRHHGNSSPLFVTDDEQNHDGNGKANFTNKSNDTRTKNYESFQHNGGANDEDDHDEDCILVRSIPYTENKNTNINTDQNNKNKDKDKGQFIKQEALSASAKSCNGNNDEDGEDDEDDCTITEWVSRAWKDLDNPIEIKEERMDDDNDPMGFSVKGDSPTAKAVGGPDDAKGGGAGDDQEKEGVIGEATAGENMDLDNDKDDEEEELGDDIEKRMQKTKAQKATLGSTLEAPLNSEGLNGALCEEETQEAPVEGAQQEDVVMTGVEQQKAAVQQNLPTQQDATSTEAQTEQAQVEAPETIRQPFHSTLGADQVARLLATQHQRMQENQRLKALAEQRDEEVAAAENILDDDSDPEETEAYIQAERAYQAKNNKGNPTVEDEIAFERAKRRHQARNNRKHANEGQGDLFIGADDRHETNKRHAADDSYDMFDRPRKRACAADNLSKSAVDAAKHKRYEQLRDLNESHQETDEEPKTKGKRKKGGARSKKDASKKPTKTQLKKQQRETANLTNLGGFEGNVFDDVANNQARSEQPTFTSRRKAEALKQLISSIPADIREDAKKDKTQIANAARDFTGIGQCRAKDGEWLVKGMIYTITNYQMLGASRMREIERLADASTEEEPAAQGGLLSDWMGLGKTIMMIANIINSLLNLPPGSARTTLIVSSPSIIIQWMSELQKFVKEGVIKGDIIRYKDFAGQAAVNPFKTMYDHDIVLATYGEVQRSYPKYDPPLDMQTEEQKQQWWDQEYEEKRGDLHRMDFLRIVLDEAQAIKNHASQTSLACRGLTAKYYWAISGTPVQNTLAELYPYFKFLKVPYTGSLKVFKNNYCREESKECTERLREILPSFMIRRTHNDELLGSKLLVLPRTSKQTLRIHFNEMERQIYQIVKHRFACRINALTKQEGMSEKKRYSNILTLILRLRQITGHILLIHDSMKDLLEEEDFEKLRKVLSQTVPEHKSEKALIKHLRRMLADPKSLTPIDSRGDASSEVKEAEEEALVGRAFGLKNSYTSYLDQVHRDKEEAAENDEQMICGKCGEPAKESHRTSCGHIYCNECLMEMSHDTSRAGVMFTRCLQCNEVYYGTETYSAQDKRDEDRQRQAQQQRDQSAESDDGMDPMAGLEPKKKNKARNTSAEIIKHWVDSKGNMLPSAKTVAIKSQILNWLEEDPKGKIIVYSQFISMVKILSRMASIEGWDHCVFTGAQSAEERAKVIRRFAEEPEKRIMFASLKSGGNGLNLVMANRVIMVDLWWNSMVEQQAFCRSYRRGQEKETALTRFIVQDSIDDDLQQMQDRKDKNIDRVLAPNSKDRMTTRDLMKLFGEVKNDKNGDPFVVVINEKQRTVKSKTGHDVIVGPRLTAEEMNERRGRA